jgi:hypothetical protein
MHVLALGAQRLTAGRQKVHAGGMFEYFLRYCSRCLDDALAAVEHEQHVLVPEECDQARNWIS